MLATHVYTKNRTEGLHFLHNTNAHRFCLRTGCKKYLCNSSGLLVAKLRRYREDTAGRFVGGIVIDIGERPTPDHYVGKNCGVRNAFMYFVQMQTNKILTKLSFCIAVVPSDDLKFTSPLPRHKSVIRRPCCSLVHEIVSHPCISRSRNTVIERVPLGALVAHAYIHSPPIASSYQNHLSVCPFPLAPETPLSSNFFRSSPCISTAFLSSAISAAISFSCRSLFGHCFCL